MRWLVVDKGQMMDEIYHGKAVYIDFDDVLCSTAQSLVEILYQEYGRKVSYCDLKCYDLTKSMKLEDEEVNRILDIAHSEERILNNSPVEKAIEALTVISEIGYEINIVTGRPPFTKASSIQWLLTHNIPYDKLYFVNKYYRESNGYIDESILSLEDIKKMNFSFAVEDSLEMADFISRHMDIPVFLIERPWNSAGGMNANIQRCRGWDQIMESVFTIKN